MGPGLTHLRLIGVHDSGEHLLLSDGDGGRYLLPLDESLKAAARRDRPRLGQLQIEIDGAIRPREVQTLMRTGLTPEEIADRTGWSVERIRRYEAPVLAEREYAANLAQQVYVRGGSSPLTLGNRVARRLHDRGVDPAATAWDSVRSEEGNWTVTATFAAGGRERTASWYFDMAGRTVVAADDEARWLSEDDTPAGPIPAPHPPQPSDHSVAVFDVEADGGVSPSRRELPPPIDLMQAMREGSSVRSRRRRRRAPSPSDVPLDQPDDALPLEEMGYDPATMGDPPGARGPHPDDTADESPGDSGTPGEPQGHADRPEPDGPEAPPESGTGHRRPKSKRPSVPSWDDIMFGTKPPS
ncbi:septation protein SepH [Nostocoides sp. F2B08]|uniref:septation protein SepH n=1 Tax=Nostocoides sp. F2B08 TaxID=2653936 RepID=UPI00186B4978|nr:septation protein SepH [Tetrasphaera sp. F2B08]